eukprot:117371_1
MSFQTSLQCKNTMPIFSRMSKWNPSVYHVQQAWYSGTVLITGCNRGLGLEFCTQLVEKDFKIHACCRKPNDAIQLQHLQTTAKEKQLTVHELDSTNDDHINALSNQLQNEPIDILILNAGIKGTLSNHSLGLLQRNEILNTINVNCIGPLLLTQALFDNVKASKRKQIVAISSLMGSISDNTSGSRVSYRVSKTAMNSVFQEIKVKGSEYDIHTLLLHPGWVQTAMGGPNAKITVTESVESILKLIDNYANIPSGGFYDLQGVTIPW